MSWADVIVIGRNRLITTLERKRNGKKKRDFFFEVGYGMLKSTFFKKEMFVKITKYLTWINQKRRRRRRRRVRCGCLCFSQDLWRFLYETKHIGIHHYYHENGVDLEFEAHKSLQNRIYRPFFFWHLSWIFKIYEDFR